MNTSLPCLNLQDRPDTAKAHDDDLLSRSADELRQEVQNLRELLRWHRDQKGDDRCWLDDIKLYSALPEGSAGVEFKLPNRDKFLTNCAKFWETRQPCPAKLHEW